MPDAMNPEPLSRPPDSTAKGGWIRFALVLLTIAAVGRFYVWTAAPKLAEFMGENARSSYYNLLVSGMLKGQLSLDVPPNPFLDALEDPYKPANRVGHGMHDASYYKGKFYIYFGVTPVIVLFLPFRLLTGTYLAENYAVVIFAIVGLLAAWALLRSVIRKQFQATPTWVEVVAVLALGLGNMVPMLLRRPHMWEIPISCSYALFMVTLYLVWQAVNRPKPLGWIAAASLTMGLAIGARPVYLLAAVILLVPLIESAVRIGRAFWKSRAWKQQVFAALGPIVAVGFGLCVYNYLRFESPFEFGQAYQFSGAEEGKLDHFSLRYIPFNAWIYLFSTPGLTWYFPFLTVISSPPVPAGQFGMENPYGMLPGMPWVLFAIATFAFSFRASTPLMRWCLGAFAANLLTVGLVFCFGGTTGRYQVDFTPTFVLLAAIGVAWLYQRSTRRVCKFAIVGAATLLAVWSALFNVLISMQHNRLLQQEHPEIYQRVARRFNFVSHWFNRTDERVFGPIRLQMTFPPQLTQNVETIVATGHEFLSDFVYIQELGNNQIRFGFLHTSRGGFQGKPVTIEPGKVYTVDIQMGSLNPPLAHPAYDGLSPDEVEARTEHVHVLFEGQTVLHGKVEFYDSAGDIAIGESGPNRPRLDGDFSGKILNWSYRDPLPPEPFPTFSGILRLQVQLPPHSGTISHPLLVSGERGRGDLIYLRQIAPDQFVVGHDRWASLGSESAPVTYEPSQTLDLVIQYPPLMTDTPDAPLVIKLDGRVIHQSRDSFFPTSRGDISVGWNKIGSSAASIELVATLISSRWLPPGVLDSYPPSGRIRITFQLPPFQGPRSFPLLSSGKTGGGDVIFVRQIDERHFTIGHDFWGALSNVAEPVAFEPGQPITLEITYPPAYRPGTKTSLLVRMGERVVLEAPDPFHPTEIGELIVGANKIGASTSEPQFSGILSYEWLAP